MPNEKVEDYLTTEEMAQRFRLSRWTVYYYTRLFRSGKFPDVDFPKPIRIGQKWLWSLEVVKAFEARKQRSAL